MGFQIWKICLLTISIQMVQTLARNIKIQKFNTEGSGQRMPLYAPDRCDENELLYPTENVDEWICDCGPGYIYHSGKDTCFAVFRQGPCETGEYLLFNHTETTTVCAKNPCQEGFVRYGGKCYELGTPNGPCPSILEGGGIFDVNATTLKVECLKGTDRLSLFSLPTRCTPGSKRDRNGNCRIIFD